VEKVLMKSKSRYVHEKIPSSLISPPRLS